MWLLSDKYFTDKNHISSDTTNTDTMRYSITLGAGHRHRNFFSDQGLRNSEDDDVVWFKKIAEEYNNILNCYDGRSA